MFGLGPATKIYLCLDSVDMRKGFDGLYGLVRDHLGQDRHVAGVQIGQEDVGGDLDELTGGADPADCFAVVVQSLGTHLVEGGQEEVRDRAEVVEDQPLVGPGPLGDGPGAGPDEAILFQRLDGRLDQAASGGCGSGPTRSIVLGAPALATARLISIFE